MFGKNTTDRWGGKHHAFTVTSKREILKAGSRKPRVVIGEDGITRVTDAESSMSPEKGKRTPRAGSLELGEKFKLSENIVTISISKLILLQSNIAK
jgi:hypothetical protein